MTRHLARHRDTNAQLMVSYMLLPDSTTHALCTEIDGLHEPLRQETLKVLESTEAQRSETLADVLGRVTYADTGKNLLRVLHETGKLKSLDIDEVIMTPDSVNRVPLRAVLEAIQKLPTEALTDKFNPHNYNTVVEGQQEQVGIAKNLLIEAEMLESDAKNKRAQAYRLAPSLNPVAEPKQAKAKSKTKTTTNA